MVAPSKQQIRSFVRLVLEHYAESGRHTLPWRHTTDPYAILVSEVMLQQTQVDRVLPKYMDFMERFPTPAALATAPLSLVLQFWVGLGYNRRALNLQRAAGELVLLQDTYPRSVSEWLQLPGVGPYTAAAVCAFAFDQSVSLIETNVRTVYIHHFFPKEELVTDAQILALVSSSLLFVESPRTWYYALMDYGSVLKKQVGNLNKKSTTYTKQSCFKGSNRQIRGAIVRSLTAGPKTRQQLSEVVPKVSLQVLSTQLTKLIVEGLVQKVGRHYTIAT